MNKNKRLLFFIFCITFGWLRGSIEIIIEEPSIKPQDIIEAYTKISFKAGNILTYYNRYKQVIVLKSGEYQCIPLRTSIAWNKILKKSLGDIRRIIKEKEPNEKTKEFKNYNNFDGESINENFHFFATDDNLNWFNYAKNSKKDLSNELKQTENCKTEQEKKFRHTEIQIQALYRAYKKANIEKNVEFLKELEHYIPVILLKDDIPSDIDPHIYSLYEACNACRLTGWLTKERKPWFMFKAVDQQVLGEGVPRHSLKGNLMMSQAKLEELRDPDQTGKSRILSLEELEVWENDQLKEINDKKSNESKKDYSNKEDTINIIKN